MNAVVRKLEKLECLQTELAQGLFEQVFDSMASIILYAETAQKFAQAGDMAGLKYAIDVAKAHLKGAIGSFNQLLAESRDEAGEGSDV